MELHKLTLNHTKSTQSNSQGTPKSKEHFALGAPGTRTATKTTQPRTTMLLLSTAPLKTRHHSTTTAWQNCPQGRSPQNQQPITQRRLPNTQHCVAAFHAMHIQCATSAQVQISFEVCARQDAQRCARHNVGAVCHVHSDHSSMAANNAGGFHTTQLHTTGPAAAK